MSENKPRPGLTLGMYPQQQETWPNLLETYARLGVSKFKYLLARRKYRLKYIVNRVNTHEETLKNLSDKAISEHIEELRKQLYWQGLQEKLIIESFATIREVSDRTLGKRHFDEQLLGGWVMINTMIVEMKTGEGKTLAATLPACTAALAGIPVHVVTANDYLATRDEKLLSPLYRQLGLSSAVVVDGMDTESRKTAYQCNIVHSTSQQIAFDYLRDRIEMGNDIGKLQIQFKQLQNHQQHQSSNFLLRGLCFTIIDEADSLLIDEAKTPLIISQTQHSEEQEKIYFDALYLATSLENKTDFNSNEQHQTVDLTHAGKQKLTQLVKSLDKYWQQRRRREIHVTMALEAKYLFQRNKHYLVRDKKVEIIDPLTGRAMPERAWEHGLHQLIEVKEGCKITGEREPLARISYQKFFKRYLCLAGMSGTVTEVSAELNSVYGLPVIKIPRHKPCQRKIYSEQVYKNTEQKWAAFIKKIKAIHQRGQPILIGTLSIADSEIVSDILTGNELPHQVLNALQDQQEATIIAQAGQLNNITVATNMAGRGTDIVLGAGVESLGGLYVIVTERNEARRIDRQLYGRCARQGDSGCVEGFMSLQDKNMMAFYPAIVLKFVAVFCLNNKPLPNYLGKILLTLPQKWIEYKHYKLRCLLMRQDKLQTKVLSFSGKKE